MSEDIFDGVRYEYLKGQAKSVVELFSGDPDPENLLLVTLGIACETAVDMSMEPEDFIQQCLDAFMTMTAIRRSERKRGTEH